MQTNPGLLSSDLGAFDQDRGLLKHYLHLASAASEEVALDAQLEEMLLDRDKELVRFVVASLGQVLLVCSDLYQDQGIRLVGGPVRSLWAETISAAFLYKRTSSHNASKEAPCQIFLRMCVARKA